MSSALVEDPADLFAVSPVFEPTLFGGLPRIFERLYEAAELARRAGDDPRTAITQRVGSQCRIATSGGAALPRRVAEDLASLGLQVLGAYGQTEHLCVAMNRRDAVDMGTVGPPMPGTEIRIEADGEIQVRRSALTFSGYLNKPEATADAFTPDGAWLRTGDQGELDDAGRLRITGRAKEIIALSTGRKIAPTPIEAALSSSPLIAHAVCHGEGHKYLVALLSLRRAVVESWAREKAIPESWPALAQHPALREELRAAIDRVNAGLARTDQIKDFAVTEAEFTTESGELTPTLKPMRAAIASRYADHFSRLHAT
jgi:long-chain acyl-CoA synthetase